MGVINEINESSGECKFRKEKEIESFESFECEDGTIEMNPVKMVELTCPKCGRTRQTVDLRDDEGDGVYKGEMMIEYCPFCKESC